MRTNGRASHTHRGPKSRWLVQWVGALLWTAFFGRNGNDYLQLPSGSLQKAVHLRFFNSCSRSLPLSPSLPLPCSHFFTLAVLPTENKTWFSASIFLAGVVIHCSKVVTVSAWSQLCTVQWIYPAVVWSFIRIQIRQQGHSLHSRTFRLPMDRRLQSQKRPSVDSSIAHFAKASGNCLIPFYHVVMSVDCMTEIYAIMEFQLISYIWIRFLWSG